MRDAREVAQMCRATKLTRAIGVIEQRDREAKLEVLAELKRRAPAVGDFASFKKLRSELEKARGG